jgi:hypothetical protein
MRGSRQDTDRAAEAVGMAVGQATSSAHGRD